jgi:hypothetical protein
MIKNLYKYAPLVSHLPYRKTLALESKIREDHLPACLEMILSTGGHIVACDAKSTALSKMSGKRSRQLAVKLIAEFSATHAETIMDRIRRATKGRYKIDISVV